MIQFLIPSGVSRAFLGPSKPLSLICLNDYKISKNDGPYILNPALSVLFWKRLKTTLVIPCWWK